MSISGVSSPASAVSGYVQRVVSGSTSQGDSSAVQEANESRDTTRQEAARGDQVAIRKLAKLKQLQQIQAPAAAQEPAKSNTVNRLA